MHLAPWEMSSGSQVEVRISWNFFIGYVGIYYYWWWESEEKILGNAKEVEVLWGARHLCDKKYFYSCAKDKSLNMHKYVEELLQIHWRIFTNTLWKGRWRIYAAEFDIQRRHCAVFGRRSRWRWRIVAFLQN